MDAEKVFISSCTRRELSRRRPRRRVARSQMLLTVLLVLVAVGVFLALHAGV